MSDNASANAEALTVYLRYREYLNTDEVSLLLGSFDRLYRYVYAAIGDTDPETMQTAARLRIQQVQTGNSIFFVLAAGLVQIWNPISQTLTLSTPAHVLGAMAGLVFASSKSVLAIRREWYEIEKLKVETHVAEEKGPAEAIKLRAEAHKLEAEAELLLAESVKARADAEKAQAEAEKLRLESQKLSRELRSRETDGQSSGPGSTGAIPRTLMYQANMAAAEIWCAIENSPNITVFRLNGVTVLEKEVAPLR